MKIVKADKKGLSIALIYLKEGKAVVYPTDTAYGLGVDATNVKSVRRLYKIKERGFKQPVHVIVSDFAMAKKYARFDKIGERLFKKFMPGPLTLVLPITSPFPSPSRGGKQEMSIPPPRGGRLGGGEALKILSAGTGTIGVRMPDNIVALSLVRKLKRPITTTSANISGGLTPYSVDEAFRQFRNKKHEPDLYLDSGKLPKVRPSTMVRIEGGKIKILRPGPISKKQIQRALKP